MRPLLQPNETPPANEYGQRRSHCAHLGISQAQFEAMYGKQNGRKWRSTGATNAAAWAQGLPKAVVAPTVKLLGRSVKVYDPSFPPTAAVISLIEKIWSTNG